MLGRPERHLSMNDRGESVAVSSRPRAATPTVMGLDYEVPLRVLLVAAMPARTRALTEHLRDDSPSGLEIVTCSTGRDALEQVALEMPDAAVLDASVPGLDLLRIYAALRDDPADSRPIIFTNHAEPRNQQTTPSGPDIYFGSDDDPAEMLWLLARGLLVQARPEAVMVSRLRHRWVVRGTPGGIPVRRRPTWRWAVVTLALSALAWMGWSEMLTP